MPADFKLDELRTELEAARDELDKWADKQLNGLHEKHVSHKQDVQKGNGACGARATTRARSCFGGCPGPVIYNFVRITPSQIRGDGCSREEDAWPGRRARQKCGQFPALANCSFLVVAAPTEAHCACGLHTRRARWGERRVGGAAGGGSSGADGT